jgi:hypothetical protein
LYAAFSDTYEKARLDEIRDTPVITVVGRPEVAVRPDSRGVVVRTVFGLVGGLVLGLLVASLREALAASRRRYPGDHAAVRAAAGEILVDVRQPGRVLSPGAARVPAAQ